jgi:hypothetical protein
LKEPFLLSSSKRVDRVIVPKVKEADRDAEDIEKVNECVMRKE